MFERTIERFRKSTRFVVHHEHELLSFSLLAGFFIDAITLRRVDLLFENLTMLFYLGVAGTSILLLHLIEERSEERIIIRYARAWLPLVTQFMFGGLFSAFLIFYSRSASLWASWPFLLLIFGVMVGNELLREYQARLTFQVSIFYFAIFSFSIFSVPVILKRMDEPVFLISGLVSLMIIGLFMLLLRLLRPIRFLESAWMTGFSVAAIFLLINILYFTNTIPPIPLALKEIGLYHNVEKQGPVYILTGEVRPWWDIFSAQKIHLKEGEAAYVYGSVFAPTQLRTDIVHVWQYYSETKREWIISNRVRFPILGGRDGGYRGHSLKAGLTEGRWRVDVETARGQLIGRLNFTVTYATNTSPLRTEKRL